MKKTLILALVIMAVGLCGAFAEETVFNFDDGSNPGFFQSGSCSVSVKSGTAHSGEYALAVTGRASNDYDAADYKYQSLNIAAGDTVTISFWAYHEGENEGVISVSNAAGDYAILASKKVPGNTWTEISGTFTVNAAQNLRFKTDNTLVGVDYYIDDVQVIVEKPEDAVPAEDTFQPYASDFSAGTDGWYARSAGTAAVEVKDGALHISGRTATWNSPGRDFDLIAGNTYRISLLVKQEEKDTAEFMLSAAHSKNGKESYENIVKVKAKKGEWTLIDGTYAPAQYDNYILYVETSGGNMDFAIKEIYVENNEIKFPENLASLKEVYAPYFDFGSAVCQAEAIDTKRMDFYASQFSILTPGNELKPDSVLDVVTSRRLAKEDDTAVAINLDAAKPLLDYCWKNGIKVHGHVLVWYQQTPDTFFRQGYISRNDYVSRDVMLARLENYIKLVLEETERLYPGLIVSWDVVNEAVNDGKSTLRECTWTQVVGEDYVEKAFEFARKYAREDMILCYNDYSTPYEPKLTGICNLLDKLVEDGTIDCYGFQAHYQVQSSSPSERDIEKAMKKVIEKGLKIRISELDIEISQNVEQSHKYQANRYENLMKLFTKYADNILAVQVWGVTDDLSWKADKYPLLFDRKVQPKPAFYALVENVVK
ncbi:MAG: endo-1,4-beta-xylanase [Clostridia bacterium]|nr:endo-1,4-beta-xylanase [Clostridia bacterium]